MYGEFSELCFIAMDCYILVLNMLIGMCFIYIIRWNVFGIGPILTDSKMNRFLSSFCWIGPIQWLLLQAIHFMADSNFCNYDICTFIWPPPIPCPIHHSLVDLVHLPHLQSWRCPYLPIRCPASSQPVGLGDHANSFIFVILCLVLV